MFPLYECVAYIWQVTPRASGSPFVQSLAAVLELPDAFRDGLANAENVAQGEVAGVPVTRYRFTDALAWAGRFISPGMGTSQICA